MAAAPALPQVAIVASLGLYLKEEGDEFERALMVEQILWSTGVLLSVATVWGFLESFGEAPHVEPYWSAVVWLVMLPLTRVFVWRRYR